MENQDIIESFNNFARKKTLYFIDHKWNGISRKDFDDWLANFETEHQKHLACKLIDMLIYYNERETEKIVGRLTQLLQRDYFANRLVRVNRDIKDEEIVGLWQQFLYNSCFFPVSDVEDSTSSGNYICRVLRKTGTKIGISEKSFSDVSLLPLKIALGKHNIIFLDDIIGTGEQVVRFWTQKKHFSDEKTTLNDISSKNIDKNFYYLSIAATESGLKNVRDHTSNLRIISSEILTKEYDIFSRECIGWESEAERIEAEKCIKKIKKEKGIHDNHSLNLPILFQHCSPNNTLELYWWHYNTDEWKPLQGRF